MMTTFPVTVQPPGVADVATSCMKIIEYIEYLALKCVCASPQFTREVFAPPC